MITEDYVSYEVAKLLKEKGFDEPCLYYYKDGIYYKDGVLMFSPSLRGRNSYQTDTYSAPTHQMAMKWLREVHNIDIEVHTDVGMLGVKVYTPFISRYKSSTEYPSKLRQYKNGLYFEDDRGVIPGIRHFETYKEAVEAALKYSLENLI